jgi:hypothetical protein
LTEKQRLIDSDYNDYKTGEGGSANKKKKAERKATKLKEAKEAEGATKDHDEAVVKLTALAIKSKRIAESWPERPDQDDGIEVLRERPDADVDIPDHSIFDMFSEKAIIRLAPILIKLSGKKKSKRNRMSVLHVMHKKYKEQLKDDPDMKRIYGLLAEAGISNAFMIFYGVDGVFDYHRDHFLSLNSNCMPELEAAEEKNTRYCHKAAPGKISFEARGVQGPSVHMRAHHQVLWHGSSWKGCDHGGATQGREGGKGQWLGPCAGGRLPKGAARASPGADWASPGQRPLVEPP